jgi:hypothetical protein
MKQYLNLFDFTQSELQDWNFGCLTVAMTMIPESLSLLY